MKNKLTYITIALITFISFINSAYSQNTFDDACCPRSSLEASSCDVSDGYRYFTVGVGPIVIIPNLGLGYRKRYTQFGWDTAISASTLGYIHEVNAHFVGHYYLSPRKRNSTYLGLGVMGGGIFTNDGDTVGVVSPDFVFGKQLNSNDSRRHFLEMHLNIPNLYFTGKHCTDSYFPMMYVKYGTSF